MKSEWTLTGLYRAMLDDLKACNSDFERNMCRAICGKEIKGKAIEIRAMRKLTPGEESVLANL